MATPTQSAPQAQPVLFGFGYKTRDGSGRPVIVLRWWRVVLLLVVFVITLWLAAVTSLWATMRFYRGYPESSFVNWFFLRKTTERERFGNYQVERALEHMEKGEFGKFNEQLRLGVKRSPGNIKGRIYLAQLNMIFGRNDLALKTYEEGIPHLRARFGKPTKDDQDFIRSYLQFLFYENRDFEILRLAKEILPAKPEFSDLYLMTAYAGAQASFLRTDYAASRKFLSDYGLDMTEEGLFLRSEILWALDKKTEAIDLIFEGLKIHRQSPRLFNQIISLYRRQEDYARALRYSTWFANARPLDPSPRVQIISDMHKLGQRDQVRAETERFIDEFQKQPDALQLLSNFATDVGNAALGERLYQIALERNYRTSVFALLYIEALVNARRYQEASEFCDQIATEKPAWLKEPTSTFNALRAVVAFGLNRPENALIHLEGYLTDKRPSDRTCLMIVKRFRDFGMNLGARRILEYARKAFPADQNLLANAIDLALDEVDSDSVVEDLSKLLDLRKPPLNVIMKARKELASDRFIFASNRDTMLVKLDQYVAEQKRKEDDFKGL